jgi:hypothetical protein
MSKDRRKRAFSFEREREMNVLKVIVVCLSWWIRRLAGYRSNQRAKLQFIGVRL